MRNIWPMGCKKTPTADKVEQLLQDPMYIAQQKIDGVRCILHFDEAGNVYYTTRGATLEDPETPIDITHRLGHMRVRVPALANYEFDGELWAPGYTSAEISGQVNYKSTVSVDPKIQLHTFDILRSRGGPLEHRPLSYRLSVLESIGAVFQKLKFMAEVPYATTEEDKRGMLATELEAGREGIVLKNLKASYIFGTSKRDAKPTNNWYKVKKKDTIDAKITGSLPPEQYYRDPMTGVYDLGRQTKPWEMGWFGSLTFEFVADNDNGFSTIYRGSVSGMTDSMKAALSDGHRSVCSDFIGRTMEIEYMEKTADGNLRHPRFIRLREEIEK